MYMASGFYFITETVLVILNGVLETQLLAYAVNGYTEIINVAKFVSEIKPRSD